MTPWDRLELFMSVHLPDVPVHAARLSQRAGYLVDSRNGHEYNIQYAGYGRFEQDGSYISKNRLWNELHEYYNAHVDVLKYNRQLGIPSIIKWRDQVYTWSNQYIRQEGR
jgi:hypothetical protein